MRLLTGRAVVITGAGRGLGRAYAHHAAAAGANVMVNDVDRGEADAVVAEIRHAGGTATASCHDISDPEQATELMQQCVAAYGRLDGLVNNAGLYHESLPWQEEPERLHRIVSVNVLGSTYCLVAASRIMRSAGGGSIVNASSLGMLGYPHIAAYAATKGAIASLTYTAALDLEADQIRVNALSPKALTRMTRDAVNRQPTPDATAAPLSEIDTMSPASVAPLVTYLLSDAAAGITGQFLAFDGRQLTILPHLDLAEAPRLTQPAWSVEEISAAFAGSLREQLQPYGGQGRRPPRLRDRP